MADPYWTEIGDKIEKRRADRRKAYGVRKVLREQKFKKKEFSLVGMKCTSCGSVIEKGGVPNRNSPHNSAFCDMYCFARYADDRGRP